MKKKSTFDQTYTNKILNLLKIYKMDLKKNLKLAKHTSTF